MKAEKIVAQMVGINNLRVQVSAAMSFDQIQRTTASVDPDKQAIAAEQKAEVVPGAQGGAGQNNTATTYENTRSTESFVSAPELMFTELRATTEVIGSPPSSPEATLPIPWASSSRLAALHRRRRTRGDVVSVVSVPFATPVAPVEAAKTDLVNRRTAQRPLLGVLGLADHRRRSHQSQVAQDDRLRRKQPVLSLQRGGDLPQPMCRREWPGAVQMPTNTMRDRVNSTIEQQPTLPRGSYWLTRSRAPTSWSSSVAAKGTILRGPSLIRVASSRKLPGRVEQVSRSRSLAEPVSSEATDAVLSEWLTSCWRRLDRGRWSSSRA
jgi:hypothetical protein